MITFAPFTETLPRERPHLPWLPLILLTTAAGVFTANTPGWARMWLIAIALFLGFKWWTFRKTMVARATCCPGARSAQEANPQRSLTYLLLWPGMNARAFLAKDGAQVRLARTTCCPGSLEAISSEQEASPRILSWTWALAKTLLGFTLLFLIARLALPTKNNSVNLANSVIPFVPHSDLLAGWIAMVGFIFSLHFGLFHLLSLFWKAAASTPRRS